MRRLCILVAAVAWSPATAQTPRFLEEIYRISESGAAFAWSLDQTVSIATLNDTGNPARWIVERHRTEKNRCDAKTTEGKCRLGTVITHDWIDSDDCPQIKSALDDLARIEVPRFAGSGGITSPHGDHATNLTIIGRPQSIKAPDVARFGRTMTAYVMVREQFGRFHQWWEQAEASLQGCWRATAPLIAGKPAKIEIHIQP